MKIHPDVLCKKISVRSIFGIIWFFLREENVEAANRSSTSQVLELKKEFVFRLHLAIIILSNLTDYFANKSGDINS